MSDRIEVEVFDKVKMMRTRRRYSIAELSEKTDIDPSGFSRRESGKFAFTPQELNRICDELNFCRYFPISDFPLDLADYQIPENRFKEALKYLERVPVEKTGELADFLKKLVEGP